MMNRDTDKSRTFTRRAVVIAVVQGSILAMLGGRLAWLQVAEGSRYRTLADKNRINIKVLLPTRGQIVDRYGVPLAVNRQNYHVKIIPEQTDDLEKSLRALQKFINIDDAQIQNVIKQAKKAAKFAQIEVKNDLDWEEVSTIEVNLPDLPGLSIGVGERRNYPFGEATAHIIGYTGAVNEAEMTDDPSLNMPGFKIGKSGIEKKYDLGMRGRAGISEVEVNVVGREIRELKRQESKPGKRVTLTLDAELQRFLQNRLAQERSASAVVMDVHTGAVYALASHPAFDPNVFSRGISAAVWEELLADPAYPLTNKAISGQYPPGSTFKMVTALAGFKSGKISPYRTIYCPGHYEFGNARFHCWKPEGHGSVDIVQALMKSCDTYFYTLSTEIGIENIAAAAREMGMGSKLGFDLTEERPGLVPDKAWKLGQGGDPWQPGETIVTSIGQGALQTTPLQLAVMTARLVNGGYAVKPWIAGYEGEHKLHDSKWPKMDIAEEHLKLILKGMVNVVNVQGGTAYGSRITEPGWEMGGKTGTAQVRRITMQQRLQGVKNEDLPWIQRHHALFVGYAPIADPRYACAVVVEHGVGGSKVAAPIAKDILIEAQRRAPAQTQLRPDTVADKKFGPLPMPI